MKKLFSVFLAALLLLQLSLFALADSSKPADAAQQYSLQVIDNVMQFVKNDKVVRSVSLQNSTISLGKNKQGGIRVTVKDSTGKSRNFTLGSQTALTVSGELQSLQLNKSLPASASISLEKGAKVESLKVSAACKVQLQGKVSQLKVTNANAKVTAEKSASIGAVSTVSANALSGISQAKITISTAGSLSAGRDQMNDDSRNDDSRYDRDDDDDDDDRYDRDEDDDDRFDDDDDDDHHEELPQEKPEEKPDDKPSVPDSQRYRITRIESKPAEVLFSLNLPTEQPLTKDDIAILCNGSGKDMTIVNVYTKDNQNYTVTTAYYADNEYFLSIQLADGSMINKTFTVSLLAPQLEQPFVEWSGENSVEITYVSDAAGSLYYLVQPVAAQTRNLWEGQEEPTADQLKAQGTKLEMKVQSNQFTIDKLDASTAYTLYYLAVDNFDRTSQVYTASIPAKTEQPEKSEITITSVEAHTDLSNFGGVHHWFDLTLSEDPQEELTKENFNISCPVGDTSLGRVQKNSATEYTLYLKERVILKDSNDFRFTVTFSDGSTATKIETLDYSAPIASAITATRKSESTVEFTFKLNEPGTVYWKIYNNADAPSSISDATIEDIIKTGTPIEKVEAGIEYKHLLTDIPAKDVTLYFVPVDRHGNVPKFVETKKISNDFIPEQTEKPEQGESNIASIIVTDDTHMSSEGPRLFVTFKKAVSSLVDNADVRIVGKNMTLSGTKQIQVIDPSSLDVGIQLMPVVPAGEYTLEIYLDDVLNKATFTIE